MVGVVSEALQVVVVVVVEHQVLLMILLLHLTMVVAMLEGAEE